MTILLGPGIFYAMDVYALPKSGDEFALEFRMAKDNGVYNLYPAGDKVWGGTKYPLFTPKFVRVLSLEEEKSAIKVTTLTG